jgi:hypothetical protein
MKNNQKVTHTLGGRPGIGGHREWSYHRRAGDKWATFASPASMQSLDSALSQAL